MKNSFTLKVAILDLYDGHYNQGMRGFDEILKRYSMKHNIHIEKKIFDVRGRNEAPGIEFDLYISSGGPGSPVDSEGSRWENTYFKLIDKLEDYNLSHSEHKKKCLLCLPFLPALMPQV